MISHKFKYFIQKFIQILKLLKCVFNLILSSIIFKNILFIV